MQAFVVHTGRAIPMRAHDVNTDVIYPQQFLTRSTATGYADALFGNWREDPGFVLNDPRRAGATIIVAGPNFGIGSFREGAAWAVRDYGIRAVIAPSFGEGLLLNLIQNGIPAVVLPEEVVNTLLDAVETDPDTRITVDVDRRTVTAFPAGAVAGRPAETPVHPFPLDDYTRRRLMTGKNEVELTLEHRDEILGALAARPAWMPRVTARPQPGA